MLIHTITNANSVPIETNSPSRLNGSNPPSTAATAPVTIVVTYGVRKRGWTFAKTGGSRPSLAIEKKIRGWPMSMTRMTELRPASAAISTAKRR